MIAAASVGALYLLLVFTLATFPYQALVRRVDAALGGGTTAGLSVDDASYRFPWKIHLEGVTALYNNGRGTVSAGLVEVKLRPRVFSQYREIRVTASQISVRSDVLDLTGLSGNLQAHLKLLPIMKQNDLFSGLNRLVCTLGRAEVQKLSLSGFQFSSLDLRGARFQLEAEDGWLAMQNGTLSADVVNTRFDGKVNGEQVDMVIGVQLTDEFFRRYQDLRGLVDSLFRDGNLQVTLKGRVENPRVNFDAL